MTYCNQTDILKEQWSPKALTELNTKAKERQTAPKQRGHDSELFE